MKYRVCKQFTYCHLVASQHMLIVQESKRRCIEWNIIAFIFKCMYLPYVHAEVCYLIFLGCFKS